MASTATISSGTKTWPPYSLSCSGRPKIRATQLSVPRVALVVHTVLAESLSALNSGVISASMMAPPIHGSTLSFLAPL